MQTNKPYVGVTGYMSAEEIKATTDGIDFSKSGRLLMVGVLASSKTLFGQTNKWPGRYPKIEQIKDIFQDNENFLNLIHYNTTDPDSLLGQLVELTAYYGGDNCHGFQLNIAWPAPQKLRKFKERYPDKKIVLQIGTDAFNQVGNDFVNLVDKLHNYAYIIDYILLDPSGGLGQSMDPNVLLPYLDEIYQWGDTMAGVAGGLSPSTLNLLDPIIKEFSDISIDAEGRLRTKEDNLDIEITRQYIQQSLDLFSVTA